MKGKYRNLPRPGVRTRDIAPQYGQEVSTMEQQHIVNDNLEPTVRAIHQLSPQSQETCLCMPTSGESYSQSCQRELVDGFHERRVIRWAKNQDLNVS